jgi:Cu/Ag efflux pump CusA
MIQWLVRSSLTNHKVVLAIAAAMIGIGVWQLPQAKADALPEFAPVTVQVQTEALGLSAQEVEQLITVPLEQDLLNGVAWLEHIHSESVPGLSMIDMTFEPGTDPLKARQVVQERMTQAFALPNVSAPPQMIQPVSSAGRVAMIGMSSKTLSPIDLGVLARWTIRPKLMGVPGVANVAIWGQRERQVQVQVDPTRLREQGVTLEQVIHSTGNALLVSPLSYLEASTPGTGGFIDTANQRLGVQHMVPIRDADGLAQVVVEDTANKLRLGDVAEVVEEHQPLIGQANVATGDGFLLVIEKFPGANTTEVTEAVEDALATMAPGLKGVEIDTTVFRPASYVETAISNLRTAGLMGGVLAILGLGAFLLSWRRALVAVVGIALSLWTAAVVLHVFGVTFNALIWAGFVLALVTLIDDAVAASAALAREKEGDVKGDVPTRETLRGNLGAATVEAARVVGYGGAILLVVLLPMFALGRLAGESFYPPLALAALTAVGASALVSLTVIPALGLLLLRRGGGESPVAGWWRRQHARGLEPLVRKPMPLAAVAVLGIVALAGVVLPTQLDKGLLPELREPAVLIRWDGAAGTALPEMTRVGTRVSEELRAIDGVANVGSHFGRAVTSDLAVGANAGMVWASISPDADYDRTVNAIQDVVNGYPGLDRQLVTYSSKRITDIAGNDTAPVTVRVYGEDYAVLQEKANEIRAALAKVDGIESERVTSQPVEPTIQVEVDLAKAREHGVKPGDVRRAATTLLSGIQVGSIFDNNKVFEVQVWTTPDIRQNLTDVGNMLIDTPSGKHVPLNQVADVKIAPSPNTITHDGVFRRVDVAAEVNGRDLDAVLADVQKGIQGVEFPLDYHAEILQDVPQQMADQRQVVLFGGFAALGVFLLIQSALGSWRLALVAFCALPLCLLGGLLVALADGGVVTLSTVAGLIAVLVLSARAMIALLQRVRELEAQGGSYSRELVSTAAHDRSVPLLTTVLTTCLALIPVVLLGSRSGLEIVRPMAAVMVGGLVTMTIVVLFILPALYLRFGSSHPGSHRPGHVTQPAEMGSPNV